MDGMSGGGGSFWDRARRSLETPPPPVDEEEAARIARERHGLAGEIRRLSGERDVNFVVHDAVAGPTVVKFINDTETDDEAAMQALALDHVNRRIEGVRAPRSIPALDGTPLARSTTRRGDAVRSRCYSYLPGLPATARATDDAMRASVGRAAGRITASLQGFGHPAARRESLWNAREVLHLAPLVEARADSPTAAPIRQFLAGFREEIDPVLSGFRHGVIHNDLSPSNLLIDERGRGGVTAVVDFGDMLEAPIICELAVAASYQISPETPFRDLRLIADAFDREFPLTGEERRALPALVMARLVGRIVITRWRAERFPENREYILRSSGAARALFQALHPLWRAGFARSWE